jgi:hypothetical protein
MHAAGAALRASAAGRSGGMYFRLLAAVQQGSLLNEYWVYLRAAVLAAALGSILATGTGQMALDTLFGITLSITQVQHLP